MDGLISRQAAIDVAVNILGERYGYPDDEDNTEEDWP